MDTAWLEDVVALAKVESFTRAAAHRNVTQSAFSRRIKALEAWCGVALVDRSTYPVGMTDAGLDFVRSAEGILQQVRHVQAEMQARVRRMTSLQSFAAPHSIAINDLPRIVRQLETVVPGVTTKSVADNFDACRRLLKAGGCDFLLCYRHRDIASGLDQRCYARIDVGMEQLVPVCVPDPHGRPRWSLARRGERAMPVLGYARGSYLASVVEHILDDRSRNLKTIHTDAFAESLKGLALQGLGIAWLPKSSARKAIDDGRLVLAGGASWSATLVLSVYTKPLRLDAVGRVIWEHLMRGSI